MISNWQVCPNLSRPSGDERVLVYLVPLAPALGGLGLDREDKGACAMLSWLRRRWERAEQIDAKVKALTRAFGVDGTRLAKGDVRPRGEYTRAATSKGDS
jgi:hypothetical protein